jgi:hypothetical protein
MAEIKSYSLWLQRISSSIPKAPYPGAIPVTGFSLSDSRLSGMASGSGGGPGKVRFDLLELTVTDRDLFARLYNARHSGANLGRGRLDAVLSSGCSRVLLKFEDALVDSIAWIDRATPGPSPFDLKLSVNELELLWPANGH